MNLRASLHSRDDVRLRVLQRVSGITWCLGTYFDFASSHIPQPCLSPGAIATQLTLTNLAINQAGIVAGSLRFPNLQPTPNEDAYSPFFTYRRSPPTFPQHFVHRGCITDSSASCSESCTSTFHPAFQLLRNPTFRRIYEPPQNIPCPHKRNRLRSFLVLSRYPARSEPSANLYLGFS